MIQHPAQLQLHAVPEPLRSRCVESFIAVQADVSTFCFLLSAFQLFSISAFHV
jgi:hypothetical protein